MNLLQIIVLAMVLSSMSLGGEARTSLSDDTNLRDSSLVCELSTQSTKLRDAKVRVMRQQFELALPGAISRPDAFLKTVEHIRNGVAKLRSDYGDACVPNQFLALPISFH